MNKQPLDARCGLKQKEVLKNSSGFTLTELIIATGISSVVSLAIASIFIYTVQQFVVMVEMNTAQENLLWASYHTKNLVSQAVNIDEDVIPGGGIGDGYMNDAGILTTTAASSGANLLDPARQVRIAEFDREWGITSSDYVATKITLQHPSETRGESGQGYVFFDVNTPPGQDPGNPDFSDVFYDKIVQYDLIPAPRVNGQTVSVNVIITTRYHKDTDRNTWVWCSPNDPCALQNDDAPYIDNTMNFSVALRNNRALEKVDPMDPTSKPRSIHGGIYYYRYIPPRINF